MNSPSNFMLFPNRSTWAGGEPRVFAIDREDSFPAEFPSIGDAQLMDIRYQGGELTALLQNIALACGVRGGSFQAVLENLEDISHEKPLVIVVRDANRLLADVGPAVIHLMTGWEGFTHHANGISAMYLVLETGPSAITQSAFYPGGTVDWLPSVNG